MSGHTPSDSELERALRQAEIYEPRHEGNTVDDLADAPVAEFFDKEGKPLLHRLAAYLIKKRSVLTTSGKRRETFVYRFGLYIQGEDTLRRDVRELLSDTCTTYHMRETLEMIKDQTAIDRETFIADLNLINLNNGVYDVRTGELQPHDPRHLFFTKIPIDFDSAADSPTIKKYLSDVLDEDQVKIVQEWFGYILYREYFIKKALICVGDGDTGKTTLITLMCHFVGEKNLSGVSLQRITYDKFAAANLYNKHLNQYDDLSPRDIEDNGAFKMATGGGLIPGEKKFGDQFMFKNYAKLTFTCNKIPDVTDTNDDAYFNRWIVLPFTRIIEEEKKDRQLIHKMTTSAELSGLLNFALEGLKRLLKNQNFSYDKETHEIKTEMMRSASSIARFASDCLEEAVGAWISKEEMHQVYSDYASENRIPSVSTKSFGSRLPMYAPYIAEFKPKDPRDPTGKKQITAWRNVRIKLERDCGGQNDATDMSLDVSDENVDAPSDLPEDEFAAFSQN